MSGNITSIFTDTLTTLGRFFGPVQPVEPTYTGDSLHIAADKLAKGICPECDKNSSLECIEANGLGKVELCRTCGTKWKFDPTGYLLGFGGRDPQLYGKYQERLAEERRRSMAIAMERSHQRNAA